MASIELNGVKFEYVERGQGDPVVLVHGSQGDYRSFCDQVERFARSFRVIAYSRRYHWPNASIAEGSDYSMLEHVADLKALIEAFELGPVQLVGHSYGAFMGLLLASMEKAMVRSLVLTEPPVVPLVVSIPPKPSHLLKLFLTSPRMAIAVAKLGGRGLDAAAAATRRGDREEALRLMGSAVLGPETFRSLSPERLAMARANFIDAEFLGSGLPALTVDQVRAVRCPVLLVGGERSPAVFGHLMSVLERLLPRVERVEIARASHLVHETEPGAYAAAVLPFLSKVAASSAGPRGDAGSDEPLGRGRARAPVRVHV